MWAVKPQYFQAALQDTQLNSSAQDKFHVSIMAGVPLDKFSSMIQSHFKVSPVRSARVMPNIAMRVSTGVSVYTMGQDAQKTDKVNLEKLLYALGLTYQVPESQINAYCGLFASGIGFMFPILEAMADGGVKMGIPRDLSLQISAQTMKGAAELLLNNDASDPSLNHPGQLKDSVCSRGEPQSRELLNWRNTEFGMLLSKPSKLQR
ncbi:Pyrroline-5-carboxylate reductase 1, mitochondrial [Orchesella cincta]|uniref:Pyrroline-5-carboxylate reductase 1, mitochondrial n=1 Tax=Orchesella cincta TaxID=48709 RepID=A0A1D2MV70_ORCCI|nr:Pyrroline-5-carboxylate reductase 1, mitochondrial [Orchesella cincta]